MSKLTEQQQARVRKCVDLLIDEKTGMDKGQLYGFCTNLEKQGKLRADGHWGQKQMSADEQEDVLSFAVGNEFIELPGEVEIFRSGNWKDGHGTPFDAKPEYVEQVFKNTKELGFVQPLKLNHTDQTQFLESMKSQTGISLPTGGLPALGYNPPTRTQKNADGSLSVFGKLTNIPKHLAEIIKNLYRNRSAEFVTVQDGKGGKKEVFSGVAFLGMTRPIITQLAASFGQMFKGENPSMIYSEIDGSLRAYEFSDDSIAAASATGDNKAAASADSSTTNQKPINQQEAKVEFCKLTMPDGSVRTFATEEEFKSYHNSQIEAAKSGTVPKAQFDALQAQIESNAQAAHFAEIDNLVASLATPNAKGEVIPPAVRDQLGAALKSIPRTIQFGETGKEVTPAKAIVKAFSDLSKVGLVPLKEQTRTTNQNQKPVSAAEKEFAEGLEVGLFEEKDSAEFIKLFEAKTKGE